MSIGINKTDSAATVTAKAATVGAAAGAGLKVATPKLKATKDTFMKSFEASKAKQQGILEHFQKSGKTISEYIEGKKANILKLTDAKKIHDTYAGFIADPKKASQLESYSDYYKTTVKTGIDKALKEADKTEKLLQKGKTSKLTAAKEGLKSVGEKISTKAASAKETITGFVKSKNKKVYLDEVKQKALPALKKYGKPALIGAAVFGAAAFAAKTILNHKAEKTQEG